MSLNFAVPENDKQRVAAVLAYDILDTPAELDFDELSDLAAQICGCPAAYISLLDETRQWIKSLHNLPQSLCEMAREGAICSRTICQHDLLEVEDLRLDDRFSDLSLVVGPPNFVFYCGAPLINSQGYALGSLCVVDFEPKKLGHREREGLRQLSRQVIALLEGRRDHSELNTVKHELESKRQEVEHLLTSVMPAGIARELQLRKHVEPRFFPSATVLFTDFFGFTRMSGTMAPGELVDMLDQFFTVFDAIVAKHRVERLKTIGDSYMCAAGLPDQNRTHPMDACLAALEMREVMARHGRMRAKVRLDAWQMRIGINTGPVVGGIVGQSKVAYDIWGNTVNIASRMESSGAPGRINVSESTYGFVQHLFEFEERGVVEIKHGGMMPMFFLERIRPALSADGLGIVPNDKFWITPAN
jgi:class 3 adenylate cyclase